MDAHHDKGASETGKGSRIAVVLKGYPRLSETFIAQELHGLEERGHRLDIHSLRQPYETATHPIHKEITASINYLPEYLWREPFRVLRCWWKMRKLPGYQKARDNFWRDLQRDRTINRVRRFGQACVLAQELHTATGMIYAHFLHTPASVARYAANIRQLPFAISAHAKDIWTTPEWEKREKIAEAAWLTTCTRYGADHLRTIMGLDARKVQLHYHGLDFARFTDPAPRSPHQPAGPLHIASVGRLVEKKGYEDLLDALVHLPDSLDWRFEHIGGGDLKNIMTARARELGLTDQIVWHGRKPQSDVKDLLAWADIFVLASKIAANGDRDGLPNVLMEAQAAGVACISTAVSAIPELIHDGDTGLLVAPGDPGALAAAITRLAKDTELRTKLATAGTERVREKFNQNTGLDAIADALRADAVSHKKSDA